MDDEEQYLYSDEWLVAVGAALKTFAKVVSKTPSYPLPRAAVAPFVGSLMDFTHPTKLEEIVCLLLSHLDSFEVVLDEAFIATNGAPAGLNKILRSWTEEAGGLAVSHFGPPPSKASVARAQLKKRSRLADEQALLEAKRICNERTLRAGAGGDPFIPAPVLRPMGAVFGTPQQTAEQAYADLLAKNVVANDQVDGGGLACSLLAWSQDSFAAAKQVPRNSQGTFPMSAVAPILAGTSSTSISTIGTVRALLSRDSSFVLALIERWTSLGNGLQDALQDDARRPEFQLATSIVGHLLCDLTEFLAVQQLGGYFLDLLAKYPLGGPAIVAASDGASTRLGHGLSLRSSSIFLDDAGQVHAVDQFPAVPSPRNILAEHLNDPIESKLAIVVNNFKLEEKLSVRSKTDKAPKREKKDKDKAKKARAAARVAALKDPRSVSISTYITAGQAGGTLKGLKCFHFNTAGDGSCTSKNCRFAHECVVCGDSHSVFDATAPECPEGAKLGLCKP